MKSQTSSNAMLNMFRKYGVKRQTLSFFGKSLHASPTEAMIEAFRTQGVMRAEPSFFGYSEQKMSTTDQNNGTTTAVSNSAFVLPLRKRLPKSLALAA